MEIINRDINSIHPYPGNPRKNDGAVEGVANSIRDYGWQQPIVVDEHGIIVIGHTRYRAAQSLGMDVVPVLEADLTPERIKALRIADNKTGEVAEWDDELLRIEIGDLLLEEPDMEFELGFSEAEIDALLNPPAVIPDTGVKGSLAAKFMVPPFSVISSREGFWQERKRAWIETGLASEVGRDAEVFGETTGVLAEAITSRGGAISIFDPVLCELAYNWFMPAGGKVLDPFAGGSVRGVVAGKLGYKYTGIDLRQEQVDANVEQWADINRGATHFKQYDGAAEDNMPGVTSVEKRGEYWFKRDDEFSIGGGKGGKVRSCWALAQGAEGLVTAGSRSSPQVNIVAQIAKKLGVPCRVHTPLGDLSDEVLMAQEAGAEVIQHKAGYNNVIIARARDDAAAMGWTEIPFGMECAAAVEYTSKAVENLPTEAKRIVIPVGSGMSLAGLLTGLQLYKINIDVVGVIVGADPIKRLDEYAPEGWRDMCTLVQSELAYADRAPVTEFEGVALDAIYEAKCIPFLEPGDLLWVVGIRASEAVKDVAVHEPEWICDDSANLPNMMIGDQFDFVFSCPPYADLEVYSDDPADISNMEYDDFLQAYCDIIDAACARLADNRFACFVVGEVRAKGGEYYNFVGDTIQAFLNAGMSYYNEMILVTPTGSLPVRAGKAFTATRKVGKSHQNILVFCKGDPKLATLACGDVHVATEEQLFSDGED